MTFIKIHKYPYDIESESTEEISQKEKDLKFSGILNEISWFENKKVDEILNSKIIKIKELNIWWRFFRELFYYNKKVIINSNWEKIISDYDYWENDYNEYMSKYYYIDWKYYYTWPKRTNDENFIQIYDLKNWKWEENSLHVLFDRWLNKIIYKWDEWDYISKKVWKVITIHSTNWETKELNIWNWELKKL